MFDKERFHNVLALSLGYERIVKEKRITIEVDDSDDPWVTLTFQACPEVVRFKASGEADVVIPDQIFDMQNEIDYIADAVHQAYIQANMTRTSPCHKAGNSFLQCLPRPAEYHTERKRSCYGIHEQNAEPFICKEYFNNTDLNSKLSERLLLI